MIDESQENPTDAPESSSEGDSSRRRSRRRGRRGKSRGAASPGGDQQADLNAESPVAAAPQPHHHEAPRPVEHRRSNKSGFGDGLDRQICMSRMAGYPAAWPVNNRAGLAMQPLIEIARTEESLLLCDLSHEGPCVWPGYLGWEPGESSEATLAAAPTIVEEREIAEFGEIAAPPDDTPEFEENRA